ncbi:MAG: T9SS type A sorting domain-containing protein [Bacteroidales bacterium]|nr:T9SS type A sorting domain-containing protein [Bacteroidales bacterium]
MKINRETVYLYDTDTTTAEKPVSNNEYEQDTTQKVVTDSLECNQTLNLVYRVSPSVEALDNINRDTVFGEQQYVLYDEITATSDTLQLIGPNREYLLDNPVFVHQATYQINVSVFEEYINMDVTPNVSDRVPTVDGTMIADNDFSTNEFPNKIALNKKGQARYAFIVSTPNITANPLNAAQNYLKNLNIRVEFTDGTPTKTWAGSFSAYVLGALSNGNNFTTKGPKMVDLILRDPPGSKSYAWIEEGSSVTKTHEWGGAAETMADLTTEWKMGLAVKTFAGVGTGVINESMAINGNSAGLHTTQKGGRDNTTSTTYTFTEKIQTSAESDYVGAEADIFVGVAYNIVFGEAMMIDIYSQTSVNDPTPDSIVGTSGNVYRVGANRGMVFAPEFETEFIYTQGHIKNSVIPNLEKIRNDYFAYYYTEAPTVNNTNSPMYISKLLPSETGYGSNNTDSSLWGMIFRNTYNNYPQIISDPVNTPSYYILCPQSWLAINPDTLATDSIMFFNNEIQGWKNVLAQNEQEKVKAEKLRNVSFDAGAIYETTDTYDSLSGHTSYYEGSVDLHGGSDFGVDINETGVLFKLSVSETGSWYDRDGEENKTSLTFGYHLEDTDPSDYHTIDILKPTNNSTVFKLLGGQTSCPYEDEIIAEYFEPNKNHVLQQATAKVQDPEMAVNTPFIGNVPGNRSANFSLQVGNRSLVSTAWYMLTVDEKTNPNGLILSIDGEPIANGRIFSFDPTESFMKTLSVKRSRQDVTRYDNIHLILSSTCQSDLFDEVYISVEFLPSCSDLVLERPVNNQIMNLVTTDEAEFVVSEYDVKYNLFNHIVLEYKPATENQYIPFASYYKDSAAYYAETDIQADRKAVIGDDNVIRRMWKAPVSDGQYMLRARSVCPAGAALTYESMSEEPLLIKDMVAPVPFGTPQPEDGILSIGDDLLLTFNEDIQPDYTYRITIQGELNGEELLHNAGLYFDGVNDVVEVNQPMNLEGKSFTVELWTIREGTAKNAVLFSHGTEDNKFEFGLTQNDEVWVNMNGNTVTSTLPLSTIAISWTHIAAVYTAPAGTAQGQIEVYVNGNNTPAIPATDVGTYSATGVISVGSDLERTSFYNGRANELRIWTKALSASQIYIQMNNKLSGTEVGLSAYWQMDEARGSLVNEKIRGRNGTTNATWFVLPAGRSLSFDGNNQYARTQILPEIESTADFSVEFWFRADESNTNACLFSTGRGDNQDYEPLNNKYFSVYFDGSKDLILRSANHAEVIASQLADGDWHHFALSVNRRSNANIYVDYNLQKAVHSSDYFGMFSGVNLWLGAMGWVKSFAGDDSVANFFKGNIDDLRIWRSALTQEGIRIAASSRLKGDEIGLRAYYPFDTTETATLIHGTLCDQVIESVSLSEEVTPNAAFTLFNGADFSTTAANIKPIRRLRNVQYSRVYNSSQIYLSLEEPMSSIENCILEISVQDVKDMHGNYLASPVKWTAFIDQNHLKWSEEHFSFVKDVFEPLSFKVTVLNKSGLGQTFSIENMPAWLTVSPSMGTIPPTGSVEITFTVNEGLNIGIYDENIYLRNSNGFNELLSIDLRVTGEEPDWSVNPSLYDYSMNIFGELNIKGIVSTDPEDMLAAFDGNTCVGVAKLRYVPEYDRYLAFLNVYGNTSNVALSFKIWDASAGIIYPMVLPDTLKFVENSYYGTARAPITFRALNYVEQLIPLNAGWNWISKNVTTPGMTSVNAAFVNNSFTANDRLKSQFNGHDEYVSSVWAGTISASGGMSSTQMYMLKVATAKTLTIVGEPVNPTTENVTVYPGWTWIGFTPQINLSLNEAFAGLNPHDGDLVKSQSAFSVYYEGTGGWLGTLNYMTPGTGYLYYGLNQDTVSFNYPAVSSLSSNRKSLGQDFADYKNAEDDILRSNYQSNLTLIARLQAEELTETDAEIKCYVGNDCRGTGKLVYVADKKAYFYFITVSGNVEGEMLSFSLQTETGEVISLKERLPYNGNQLYGTIDNPVVFTLGSEENTLKAYPNPFHSELTLTYTLTEEETGTIDFNITDITGKTLVSFSQTHAKAGYYTLSLQDKMTVLSSGIYMISMTSSTGKQMIKVVKNK